MASSLLSAIWPVVLLWFLVWIGLLIAGRDFLNALAETIQTPSKTDLDRFFVAAKYGRKIAGALYGQLLLVLYSSLKSSSCTINSSGEIDGVFNTATTPTPAKPIF